MTVHVVGIGADGWDGLPVAMQSLVRSASVVLGGARQLALIPQNDQRLIEWPSPLRENLPALLADLAPELETGSVVALASGDPLVAGIGTTLIRLLGRENVIVHPAVSSVALARARMGWPAASVEVIRDPRTVTRHLSPGRRILVLSTDASTPGEVAESLAQEGFGESRLTVLADLGTAGESISQTTADSWSGDASPLHVLAIDCVGSTTRGLVTGLPDDAFEHDGQLTKRDLRASALARLTPQPRQLLWDIGAGAGSVAIEWMRAHATCRAIAIERSADRAARISRNALALGVPALFVVTGEAPDVLVDLAPPDAVFIGGGATAPGLVDAAWSALRQGGRLVVHGVTLETESLLAERYAEHGGELTRISIEQAAPLGGFTGWTPARAVTQWAVTKP